MGVTSLWTIVQPCARPIKIDTLNKKRLAIDASIWVYHFLKAVRDKEGNALRNSHVVGFYRRICKLLFFGIKPVFVFDGGAPALKRQTITGRKQRREGRREDAARTASKLLAVQMQRRAEEDEQKRKEEAENPPPEESQLSENLVYVDELQMTEQERQQNRRFRKKDQYHLPDLHAPLSELGQPNDPRVMSLEELQEYARQFEAGEDINVYDFSKIDFNSPFFTSLPATDRYNILNAARLRSRLRMGYSRDQLEAMFPDRMAFSRFQIERVRERNELTQRLMQVGTVEDGTFGLDGNGRVAGEKGREYVLVKNPGVEGGWALGVIGESDPNEGKRGKPIDIDELEKKRKEQERDRKAAEEADVVDEVTEDVQRRREEFYKSRRIVAGRQSSPKSQRSQISTGEDEDSLFVTDDRDVTQQRTGNPADEDSEDEQTQLQIAIAMSMQDGEGEEATEPQQAPAKPINIEQKKASMSSSFASTRGKFSSLANKQSQRAAPKRQQPTEISVSDSSSDNEPMDLEDALAESRKSRYRSAIRSPHRSQEMPLEPSTPKIDSQAKGQPEAKKPSSGLLPFEKLDLGTSLLGKKKMQQFEEEEAGGFEKSNVENESNKPAVLAPPWFSGDVKKGIEDQRLLDVADSRRDRQAAEQEDYNFTPMPRLCQEASGPIDIDAIEKHQPPVFTVESSDDDSNHDQTTATQEAPATDTVVRMGDMANAVKAAPPVVTKTSSKSGSPPIKADVKLTQGPSSPTSQSEAKEPSKSPTAISNNVDAPRETPGQPIDEAVEAGASDEEVEWSVSDYGEPRHVNGEQMHGQDAESAPARPDSPDDVYVPTEDALASMVAEESPSPPPAPTVDESIVPASGTADQDLPPASDRDLEALYSDSEDEILMQQLATEAEEHARFASSLNNHCATTQNIIDYEAELKSLRTQQKKDRRDADEVTHIMIQECQQLLKLFGLPYITAPMEAEAQCAELVRLGLVDGIVTDDSDIFLFGGTRVYKNMFNQAKFVECYLAADLTHDFDLTRNKLINIAHLLGSDYTEGLPGVGPVTALEILTEFSGDDNALDEFAQWFKDVQQGTADTDVSSTPFRRKFKKQATKIILPLSFPNRRVDEAYLKPEVDSDPSAFQWGVPDLDALRSFLTATIGWDRERTDEVLVPVIRDMNVRERDGQQSNITDYLGGGDASNGAGHTVGAGAFAPRVRAEGKSRRMESTLERMAERARKKRKEAGLATDGVDGDNAIKNGEADAVITHTGATADEVTCGSVSRNGATKATTEKVNAKEARAKPMAHGGADDDEHNDDDVHVKTKNKKGTKRKSKTNETKAASRNKKMRVA